MKTLSMLLMVVMFWITPCFADGRVIGWPAENTVPAWLTYWWTANSDSDSKDYGPPPTVANVTYVTGTVGNAANFTPNTSSVATLPAGIINGESGRIGFWYRVNTNLALGVRLVETINGGAHIYIVTRSDGEGFLFYYDDGTTEKYIYTITGLIVVDTWYFVEVAWNISGGTLTEEIIINGTLEKSGTVTMGIASFSSVTTSVGYAYGPTGYNIDIDNIIFSNDSSIDLYNSYRNQDGM